VPFQSTLILGAASKVVQFLFVARNVTNRIKASAVCSLSIAARTDGTFRDTVAQREAVSTVRTTAIAQAASGDVNGVVASVSVLADVLVQNPNSITSSEKNRVGADALVALSTTVSSPSASFSPPQRDASIRAVTSLVSSGAVDVSDATVQHSLIDIVRSTASVRVQSTVTSTSSTTGLDSSSLLQPVDAQRLVTVLSAVYSNSADSIQQALTSTVNSKATINQTADDVNRAHLSSAAAVQLQVAAAARMVVQAVISSSSPGTTFSHSTDLLTLSGERGFVSDLANSGKTLTVPSSEVSIPPSLFQTVQTSNGRSNALVDLAIVDMPNAVGISSLLSTLENVKSTRSRHVVQSLALGRPLAAAGISRQVSVDLFDDMGRTIPINDLSVPVSISMRVQGDDSNVGSSVIVRDRNAQGAVVSERTFDSVEYDSSPAPSFAAGAVSRDVETKTKRRICAYLNETTNEWQTSGVSLVSVTSGQECAAGTCSTYRCATTHFTTFVAAYSVASDVSSSPVPAPAPKKDNTVLNGVYAGMGGLVLVGIIAGIVIARRRRAKSQETTSNSKQQTQTNNNVVSAEQAHIVATVQHENPVNPLQEVAMSSRDRSARYNAESPLDSSPRTRLPAVSPSAMVVRAHEDYPDDSYHAQDSNDVSIFMDDDTQYVFDAMEGGAEDQPTSWHNDAEITWADEVQRGDEEPQLVLVSVQHLV